MKLKIILLTFRDFCVFRGQKIQTLNNQLIKTLAENQKLPIIKNAQQNVQGAARTLTDNTRVSEPLPCNTMLDSNDITFKTKSNKMQNTLAQQIIKLQL